MRGLVEVRPAAQRQPVTYEGVASWHSFSAGGHYDPTNVRHGTLVAMDEHLVAPGAGFAAHQHAGVDIVTWVLAGSLRHTDSAGGSTVVVPGQVAHLRTGRGVEHSEVNASEVEPLRFLQMWLLSDGPDPSYEVHDYEVSRGSWLRALVGPTTLLIAQPAAGSLLHAPSSAYAYVLVTRGTVEVGEFLLGAGDAARCTDAGPLELTALDDAEALVLLMPA